MQTEEQESVETPSPERLPFVKITHDGTWCIVTFNEFPGMVATMFEERIEHEGYELECVYMTQAEYEALPEFDGF